MKVINLMSLNEHFHHEIAKTYLCSSNEIGIKLFRSSKLEQNGFLI